MSFPDNRSTNNGDSGSYWDSGGEGTTDDPVRFTLKKQGPNSYSELYIITSNAVDLYADYPIEGLIVGLSDTDVSRPHDDVVVTNETITVNREGEYRIDLQIEAFNSGSNIAHGLQLLINGSAVEHVVSSLPAHSGFVLGNPANVGHLSLYWEGQLSSGDAITAKIASTAGFTKLLNVKFNITQQN